MTQYAPLWSPKPETFSATCTVKFINLVNERFNLNLESFLELYDWSIECRESFWETVWDFSGVIGIRGTQTLVHGESMEQSIWFGDATLNFAENLLRRRGDDVAIYFRAEDKAEYQLTWDQLYQQVASLAAWLKSVGVGEGDRVAGLLPNMPEAVVGMLATTSLGAIWTSTSPDFGTQSVVERFGQTEPKVLICSDGYFYNGKTIDVRQKVLAIQEKLETIEQTLVVRLAGFDSLPGLDWQAVLSKHQCEEMSFQQVGFNHPLYILYSSGTTGKPKCIAHRTGGVLLQHLKELQLHSDVRQGDTVFYFTTCGWMMWNWLASSLACGASMVLYDGSPFYPGPDVLWDYAEEVGVTLFGTSAKYIDVLKKENYSPKKNHTFKNLRTLCSTGSVLVPESYDYVYENVKDDICLSSISGGTDIVSCFVLGSPILPVYRGESQCRGLGMAVNVFDASGQPVIGEKGELVCCRSFPSQPAFFWGDADGKKYHEAYFNKYENIWHHGDFVKLLPHGGVSIYGRSDATLNPGGVRIGTAEIYRYVEQLPEVQESIAIGQDWDEDVRVVLFVVLIDKIVLTDALQAVIRKTIRENCSPRHVPAKIVQVKEIPRTKSGKIVELAVRDVVHGRAVKNIGALANPMALDHFKNLEVLE
ncbi:MAG: acetoacetyl-CoA synthetase [Desulforhopalus sp.]|jgi:acetoacetyl-CoA synthetase